MNYRIALIIPTCNAGNNWEQVLQAIHCQTCKVDNIILIDSQSSNDTVAIAQQYNAEITIINKKDFTHGYARHKMIMLYPDYDIYILLTQDAMLASPHSIEKIIKAFDDPCVGAAYGRHLPYAGCHKLEKHNRQFNYPQQSAIKSKADIPDLGFKTIFCSNSFAAYRKTAYHHAGGFPIETNFGEDTLLCAKMILNNWSIAYTADATVFHSHNNSVREDYRRFYEIGKFHKQNMWLYEAFGKPGGEGMKYLWSQIKYAVTINPLLLVTVAVRTINKYLAYKAGLHAKVTGLVKPINVSVVPAA